jgi:hypothetical protein
MPGVACPQHRTPALAYGPLQSARRSETPRRPGPAGAGVRHPRQDQAAVPADQRRSRGRRTPPIGLPRRSAWRSASRFPGLPWPTPREGERDGQRVPARHQQLGLVGPTVTIGRLLLTLLGQCCVTGQGTAPTWSSTVAYRRRFRTGSTPQTGRSPGHTCRVPTGVKGQDEVLSCGLESSWWADSRIPCWWPGDLRVG